MSINQVQTQKETHHSVIPSDEFSTIPLSMLHESKHNPRKKYSESAHVEMVESIKERGVLVPLLVRYFAMSDKGPMEYEILAGSRRFRAAKACNLERVPCRIVALDDARAYEVMMIENLQRQDLFPLEEAEGYELLLNKAGYDVNALAEKVGKSIGYIYARLKLLDLIPSIKKAFQEEALMPGHAILLARLTHKQQEETFKAARNYVSGSAQKEIMSVRDLALWIRHELHLDLQSAAFDKGSTDLLPKAGSCIQCPKRTGFNEHLYPEMGKKKDECTDPSCFQSKVSEHVKRAKEIATKEHGEISSLHVDYGFDSKEHPKALKKHDWKECKKNDQGAKPGIIIDGPKAGTVVWHRNPNKPGGGNPDIDKYKVQEKKERAKVRNTQTYREAVFTSVMKSYKLLREVDLQFIACRVWDRQMDVHKKRYGKLHKITEEKSKVRGFVEESLAAPIYRMIGKMDANNLGKFLLETVLISELDPSQFEGGPDYLFETAKRYRVDTQKIKEDLAEATKHDLSKDKPKQKTLPIKQPLKKK